MTLDATARNAALKLIASFGKVITLTTVTPGEYNTATLKAVQSSSSVDVKAIVEDYSMRQDGQAYAGGLIQVGDKKVTIAAPSLAALPTTADRLKVDGIEYVVQNVKVVYGGELPALYELQGRK